MTEQEFETTKAALLEVLQSTQSEKVKIRAAELLLMLEDRFEDARWDLLSPRFQAGVKRVGLKQR